MVRVAAVAVVMLMAANMLSAVADAAARVPSGTVPPESSRPFATLPHLGPPPVPCFPYGSSDNICTGPSWPYPPNANYLYATYYGTVYISPHIVDVGQDITATAVGNLGGTPTWAAPPGPIVAGCQDKKTDSAGTVTRAADATCTWKATVASSYPPDTTVPGHGYDEWGMDFCGFFGCAESSDFFYVLPHKRAISGIITTTGANKKDATEILPVAGAVVHITGTQSGTAVTDADGFYNALVDPGNYSVSATADIDGTYITATPTGCASVSSDGSSCRVSTGGGDAAANFTVGCGPQVSPFTPAPATSGGPEQPALSWAANNTAALTGPKCPLKVVVKVLEVARSGLAFHGRQYNEFPVDFVESKSGGVDGNVFRCESGCVDVLVTVINPKTHAPVPGATVNASISAISNVVAGAQSLCQTSADGLTDLTCSDYLLGLKSNDQGNVYLRYWAPGLVTTRTTTLKVTAKWGCSATACSSREMEGSARPLNIKVSPDLIYNHSSPISEEQAEELAAWAGGTAFFTKFLKVTTTAPHVLEYALKWLEANEIAVETAVKGLEALEKVEPIFGVIEVFKVATELWERESMISMFFEDTGLNPIGLGDNPFEATAPAAPTVNFLNHIVNYGVIAPFDIGADGAWWGIAQDMRGVEEGAKIYGHPADLSDWGVKVRVYEISHCDVSKDCDPGYGNDVGTDPVLRDGIEPELELQVVLTYSAYNPQHTALKSYNFGTDTFTIGYDAIAWDESQDGLRGVVSDAGA
jgi:hypothetical protein